MDDRVVHASFSDPHIGLDIGRGTYIVTRYLGDTQFPNASHLYGIDKCQILAPLPEEPKAQRHIHLQQFPQIIRDRPSHAI